MRDRHEDCRYWGLTAWQCYRYHDRVTRYWGRRARENADKSIRTGNIAVALALASLTVLALTVTVRLIVG